MLNVKMQSKPVQSLSPKITVIGVGGAGGNAVNNMIASSLEGCEFLVCNTDAQALDHSLSSNKIQLGENVTGGLGAGSKPEVGRAAAEESLDEVMAYLDGANMAFVTAGMGGGTGTGAAPVIAKACRERGILTVGVVTKPFHFEGSHRMEMAEAGIKEMQDYVDTLIVIPNQNLFRVANEKTTFADGFKMADSVLQSGVRGVTDLMVRPGLVNLDFADIRTAMLEMGKAMMGTGEATGEKRAIEAAEAAINNPLLDDVTMKGARGVIINVTGGYDMTLFEADEACNRIRDEVDSSANIIFGATFDESMEGSMRVSIVATGIEREAELGRRRDGSSGLSAESAKTVLERAVPKAPEAKSSEEMKSDKEEVAPVASAVMPSSPGSYKTGAQNLRGITAPVAPAPVTSTETSHHDAEKQEAPDMFEQSRYEETEEQTSMRGTRYKDSFIPPKPVAAEPEAMPIQTPMPAPMMAPAPSAMPASVSVPMAAPAQPSVVAQKTSGLVLNPPKPRQSEMAAPASSGHAPSFFERLAGSVQKHLMGDQDKSAGSMPQQPAKPMAAPQAAGVSSPSLGGSSMTVAAPAQSMPAAQGAQGQLNIDVPSAAPQPEQGDLDIPAFLRRQAN